MTTNEGEPEARSPDDDGLEDNGLRAAATPSERPTHNPSHGHEHRFRLPPTIARSRRQQFGSAAKRGRPLLPILAIVAFLIILVWLALWVLPPSLVDETALNPEQTATQLSNARTTLIQALGGSILLSGLYFTARSHWASVDSQRTERFSKSIAQLGDANLDVRLGAIVSLGRLARDAPKEHGRISDLLVRFIHAHAVEGARAPADVELALEVLAERPHPDREIQRLQLAEANLRSVRINRGNLSWADFCYSDLEGAELTRCDLRNACFSFGSLPNGFLTGSDLHGVSFMACDLRGSYFNGTDCTNATFRGAQLDGTDFGERANPDGSVRSPAPNLSGVNFTGASMRHTNLEGADLTETVGLTREQIDQAATNKRTKVPRDLRTT